MKLTILAALGAAAVCVALFMGKDDIRLHGQGRHPAIRPHAQQVAAATDAEPAPLGAGPLPFGSVRFRSLNPVQPGSASVRSTAGRATAGRAGAQ
jgi:hypothetical protein